MIIKTKIGFNNSKFNYCICSKRQNLAILKPDEKRDLIIVNLVMKTFNVISVVKEKLN